MAITLDLNNFLIEDNNRDNLMDILDCANQNLLDQKLSSIGEAAIQDYLNMILGKKVTKKGSDLLEYRLFLLIRTYFNNYLPDERQVSRLFQTTTTESRSLIRSVMSKYQYKLVEIINNSILHTLHEIKLTNKSKEPRFTFILNNLNLVLEMNRILAILDGSALSIGKAENSMAKYEIPTSSVALLYNEYEKSETIRKILVCAKFNPKTENYELNILEKQNEQDIIQFVGKLKEKINSTKQGVFEINERTYEELLRNYF